jgi:hypothetical protein
VVRHLTHNPAPLNERPFPALDSRLIDITTL